MKNDWGNYSEVLRKAFEFENVSMIRKNESDSFEIDNPKLSVVLTGTKNQLLEFIPSTENGLFSRFMHVEFPLIKVWKDVFDESIDFYDYYNRIAEQLKHIYFNKTHKKFRVSFTDYQKREFHKTFSTYQYKYDALLGDDSIASIRRIGNMHFRIAMLLTAIRGINFFKERKNNKEHVTTCNDNDFKIANTIVIYLLNNLRNIYGYLPKSNETIKNMNRKQTILYENLNDIFSFSEFKDEAKRLNIAFGTAENYLRIYQKNKLIERISQGKYEKLEL